MIFNKLNNNGTPSLAGMDFTFRNESDDVAVIDIDGMIGRDLLKELLTGEESENTGKKIKEKIRDISASKIIVNINSPGGIVNDGLYIHDLLAEHPAEIETVMRGKNASAATIIGQSGDVRKMSDNGLYLVHVPSVGLCGMLNKYDAALVQKDLKKVEERILNIYEKRADKDKDFKSLMEEERGRGVWLNPDQALEYGLVDEVYEPTEETEDTLSGEEMDMMNALGIPVPEDELDKRVNDLEKEINELKNESKKEEPAAAEEARSENHIETEMFIKSNEV